MQGTGIIFFKNPEKILAVGAGEESGSVKTHFWKTSTRTRLERWSENYKSKGFQTLSDKTG
ncbi:hypothetical protein AB434_1409 [Heyndrickxia coagulans]|uniref:Uncharacterized protein n=1 Tax=Heyndrickxia coagulans TaxID=1398 RepID=A0A150K6E3_HEYCO|nr:hypothetical protein AB434_1409 [Heyndrickxia coagulans]KGT37900.1 hypothetical protein P421_12855 [Heyndrickxia coagulans P38]APB38014.1 hypothetical protein BIZ35_15430 [Heyndrickxia coagulans]ATW84473.1 hypothetical protein CIW84_16680 [Heyndrickxia coagulans]AVD54861.1 hypothetical protein C3766_01160 [Heyndrickxia coagulans]